MSKLVEDSKGFKILIFIVVLMIPVIYSFFYLKSYWDPYGNLKDVKVAMVNLDQGDKGEELIKNMKDADNTLGFEEVSSENAWEGIANDTYYAIITIPRSFSKDLESGGEENKNKAVITFTPNKRKNYLAYQIINSGLKSAENELQAKVASETAKTLANKLREVPDSLDEIIEGTGKIQDGSESLTSGLKELSDGTSTLDSKYTEFDEGINSASDGSEELVNGLKSANEGIKTLSIGSSDLDEGVTKINEELDNADTSKIIDLANGIEQLNEGVNGDSGLANGMEAYISGVNSIVNGTQALENGITKYVDGQNAINEKQDKILKGIVNYYNGLVNAGMEPDATLTQLKEGATQVLAAESSYDLETAGDNIKAGIGNLTDESNLAALSGGEKALKNGVNKLSVGTQQLYDNSPQILSLGNSLGELKNSLLKVQGGTSKLKNGITELQSGTDKIEGGAYSLSKGLDTLNSNSRLIKDSLNKISLGANSAFEGSEKITNGMSTLRTSVEDGKKDAEKELKKLDGLEEFVEDPVEFKEESFGEVESYGVGFTPLFISIGLWVGALMLYVVLYYDQKHRFGILDHENKNKILQNCIYLGIGAIEGIITGLILKQSLGFNVSSMGTYLFECVLTGMAFLMIIQFLIRNLGDIGKFVALIILVLQLAASGGTFPVETISKGFQAFTNWLPMTYTIKIFKDCLVKTDASLIGKNTLIVLLILVCLFALNTIIEYIKLKKTDEPSTEKED